MRLETNCLRVILSAVFIAIGANVSFATAYKCTEAKTEARLGSDGSVSSNHSNGKCVWSVNGVSSEFRPDLAAVRRRTLSAINTITRHEFGRGFGNDSKLSVLMDLLVGPFQGENISERIKLTFGNEMRQYLRDFEGCISSGGESSSFDRDRVFCRQVSARDDRRFDKWSLEIFPTQALLVIGAEIERERYIFSMPVAYLNSRFQFRLE
jgi:hypothetical protein